MCGGKIFKTNALAWVSANKSGRCRVTAKLSTEFLSSESLEVKSIVVFVGFAQPLQRNNNEDYKPFILAAIVVEIVASSTIDIELTGISIAAITGDNIPCTAKDNPIML